MSEAVVRSYFAACSSGSPEEIRRHFTDGAVIYDTNHAPVVGSATIGDFWARIRAKWVRAVWTVDTYVGDNRIGAIEWTMTGTHDDRPFAVRGSEHYEFVDGRIDQIRQYWTFDPGAPGSELVGYDYGADHRFA
ncbi:MAG: nuclear transport factor 2 family protein [Actinomycetia bacterium]|nr:nuclear transport factor 2 family protein [Actinomycetes bacterium]